MRVLLVINPRSGSADSADPAALLERRGCDVEVAPIDEAAAWCRAGGAVPADRARGVERVVVAGGDGSIGTAAALAAKLEVPLGVIPAGTANDFARVMELPEDIEAACALAATGSELRDVDLARIDELPFVNVASFGIAPEASEQASGLKHRVRALAYPLGAAIASLRMRPISIVAKVDGELAWSGKAWQAMVASTGAFGGWASTGRTRDGDGQLDLVVVPAGRATRELVFDAAALLQGELASREGVQHVRGRRIELTLHDAPRMVVDGELVDVDDRHVAAAVDARPVRLVVG